jgi:hypothetical protein
MLAFIMKGGPAGRLSYGRAKPPRLTYRQAQCVNTPKKPSFPNLESGLAFFVSDQNILKREAFMSINSDEHHPIIDKARAQTRHGSTLPSITNSAVQTGVDLGMADINPTNDISNWTLPKDGETTDPNYGKGGLDPVSDFDLFLISIYAVSVIAAPFVLIILNKASSEPSYGQSTFRSYYNDKPAQEAKVKTPDPVYKDPTKVEARQQEQRQQEQQPVPIFSTPYIGKKPLFTATPDTKIVPVGKVSSEWILAEIHTTTNPENRSRMITSCFYVAFVKASQIKDQSALNNLRKVAPDKFTPGVYVKDKNNQYARVWQYPAAERPGSQSGEALLQHLNM